MFYQNIGTLAMRRYFFDLRYGSESVTDDEGIVLPDLDAVQEEAMRALIAVVRDLIKMPGTITVEVRDEDGPVMNAMVAFEIKRTN